MPRQPRNAIGGYVYHVLNRANARVQIFDNDGDYRLFENVLEEGVEKFGMRILAYSIMPNHWHLVLYPHQDSDLSEFMKWLTNTHTKRWHAIKKTTGQGHLYQGRFKSFIVQDDNHLIALARYVERNAKKANLVKKAENWKWSSVWRRENGTVKQKKILSSWPIPEPRDYLSFINEPQTHEEEESIEKSIQRDRPFGKDIWVDRIVKKLGLESTMRSRGRPKKGD